MHDLAKSANPMENLSLAATAALVLGAMFITIGVFGIGVALPHVADAFAGSPNAALWVQIAGGIAAPAFALASPLAGRVISRHGERTVYIASAWLVILCGAGAALCTAPWQLVALRTLLGVGVAGVITAAKGGIAQTGERKRHMLFSLVAFLGSAMGIVIFPLVGALATMSWRYAFLSNLLLVPIALLAMALPRQAIRNTAAPGTRSGSLTAGLPLPILFAAAASGWAMITIPLHTPFYLRSIGIADPVRIGSILGMSSAFTLVGTLAYGLLQRFVGTRRTIATALAVIGGGGLLTGLSGIWIAEISGICLLGFGAGMFAAGIYAFAVESARAGTPPAEVTGMVSLATYGPQLFFPMAAGAVTAAVGTAPVYAMVAVLILMAMFGIVLRGRAAT